MAGGKVGDDGKDKGGRPARGFVDEDCGLPLVLLIEKITGPWRMELGERDVTIRNVVTKKVAWRGSRKNDYAVAISLVERFNSYEAAREFPPAARGHSWSEGMAVSPSISPVEPSPPAPPLGRPLDLNWEPRR